MNENNMKLTIGKNCELTYDRDGNLIIGKNCEGATINSAEIQILDRTNADIEKERFDE